MKCKKLKCALDIIYPNTGSSTACDTKCFLTTSAGKTFLKNMCEGIRKETGHGMMDIKRVLIEQKFDINKTKEYLNSKEFRKYWL